MKKFWILWNPKGTTPPTAVFSTLDRARLTAADMQSRIGPGIMYVMEAVAGCEVRQIKGWKYPKRDRPSKR